MGKHGHTIAFALLLLSLHAHPFDDGYPITVSGAQKTELIINSGDFGEAGVNSTLTLEDSLTFINTDSSDTAVSAAFKTKQAVTSTYGLISAAGDYISADNFMLGKAGSETPLDPAGAMLDLGPENVIPARSTASYNAILRVIPETPPGTYTGTLWFKFSRYAAATSQTVSESGNPTGTVEADKTIELKKTKKSSGKTAKSDGTTTGELDETDRTLTLNENPGTPETEDATANPAA